MALGGGKVERGGAILVGGPRVGPARADEQLGDVGKARGRRPVQRRIACGTAGLNARLI